jgi:prophage antirepressor-like protein
MLGVEMPEVVKKKRAFTLITEHDRLLGCRNGAGGFWLSADTVCQVLGLDVQQSLNTLKKSQKSVFFFDTPDGPQVNVFVNYQGICELLTRVSNAKAADFNRWYNGEVLPAILKELRYARKD